MGMIEVNGQEFSGKSFSVKKGVLYIDGHAVMDMRHDSDYIEVKNSENSNITTDKKIIIDGGNINGILKAETIVINDAQIMDGAKLEANRIVDNR